MSDFLRPMTQEERNYSYSQSQQLSTQSGFIGTFTTDSDTSHWKTFSKRLDTAEFQADLNRVEHILLYFVLQDPESYCAERPESQFTDHLGSAFGFRADTEKYTFLVRMEDAESPLDIFCYERNRLDTHIENAKQGIRFVDSKYSEKFRISDGEKISLTLGYDGEHKEPVCRYIDPAHFELGTGGRANLYHIDQFAEIMKRNGNTYEPVLKNDIEDINKMLDLLGAERVSEQKPSIAKQLAQAKAEQVPKPKSSEKTTGKEER